MSAACRGRRICCEMIQAKERGGPLDAEAYANRVATAVKEVVHRQADSGIDIVADGEMGRFGFIPYVNERLAGIEPRKNPGGEGTWARSREYLAFPEYYSWAAQMPGTAGRAPPTRWVCTGPIAYKGHDALKRDIDTLKAALAGIAVRGSLHAGGVAGPTRRTGTRTNSTRPTRSSEWRWPTRSTRNTRRSSMPASSCRSTTRNWRATIRRTPSSTSPNAAAGRMRRSSC